MEPAKSPITGVPPGQVPGRELSIGEVLEMTFSLYQRDFSKYFLLFAIVEVVIGVVNALVRLVFVLPCNLLTRRLNSSTAGSKDSLQSLGQFS